MRKGERGSQKLRKGEKRKGRSDEGGRRTVDEIILQMRISRMGGNGNIEVEARRRIKERKKNKKKEWKKGK